MTSNYLENLNVVKTTVLIIFWNNFYIVVVIVQKF